MFKVGYIALTCTDFVYFQIDMATFLTLTDQDLRELGLTTFGARRKMLLAIDGTYMYMYTYNFLPLPACIIEIYSISEWRLRILNVLYV